MFKYYEESRLLWFNSDSFESNLEFELIGILLGKFREFNINMLTNMHWWHSNYQYLVYGGLIIATSGVLENNGQVVILNGTISIVNGGTYSGSGEILYLNSLFNSNSTFPYDGSGSGPSMSIPNVKYSASFSSSASIPIDITHGLKTTDITYSVRENNNFITANVVIQNENSIMLTTNADIINGRINIIG